MRYLPSLWFCSYTRDVALHTNFIVEINVLKSQRKLWNSLEQKITFVHTPWTLFLLSRYVCCVVCSVVYISHAHKDGHKEKDVSVAGCSMTTTEGRKATQFESILVSFLCNESIRKIFKYFYFCRDWTIQWTWKTIIHTKYPAHWSVWRCDETLQNWGVIHNF